MSSLPAQLAAPELRHELRTPVNVIVGYCEMLIESAPSDDESWRAPLDATLVAVRDALARINTALPQHAATVAAADVDALRLALREPQERMLSAVQSLLDHPLGQATEARTDLQRVLRAAGRLTEVVGSVASSPSEGAAPALHSMPALTTTAASPLVLVVDDIEENRDVLARRLKRMGCSVVLATNGVEALQVIAREPVDAVLLDVMMPELDGFAVLERVRSSATTRDLPVIMISALDDLASTVRCIEHGADDYLTKPFDPVILRARVGACVERKRARDREQDYLRQVAAVIEAAVAVEEGRYDGSILGGVAERADEVGRLARVFDRMAGGVRARETRLTGQLGELRREIELARAARATPGSKPATT